MFRWRACYITCTRARDFLLVSGVIPVSEFLDDLAAKRIASRQRNAAGVD